MEGRVTNSIRPGCADDLPTCAALIARIPFFAAYFTQAQALAMLQGRPPHHSLLLAEQAGSVVGLSWFVDRDQLSRGGYLKLFAVAPEVQGAGVAGELLRATEQAVFTYSPVLFLFVNTTNQQARRFYARHGFTALAVIPDYAAAGQHEELMMKRRT